ncbi:MAG: acyl-CoA dehydrogenase, partial [Calditrichaeota bacterium]
ERTFDGLSTGAEEKKMGIKSSSTRQVIFDNVKVPVENLLGEVGQGAKIAFNILNTGRFKLGAGCVGGAKDTLAIAAKYAQERVQFGVPIASFGLIQEKLGEIALRIYAVESAVYRTAGLIDEAIGGNKAPAHQLKCIEEYATECSIIKVMGSELLDFAADEGLQIHGGYGYSQDYEIERIYRDSRINRIYEGTNEINRILIPEMLVKRSQRGELPLLDAAKKLSLNLAGLTAEKEPEISSTLATQQNAIRHSRNIILLLLGSAGQVLGDRLRQEQEVVARLANMIMVTYAGESALLRTLKLQNRGEDVQLQEAMTQAYIESALAQIRQWALEATARYLQGDVLKEFQEVVATLTQTTTVNTIQLRRQIAEAVLKANGYPVDY